MLFWDVESEALRDRDMRSTGIKCAVLEMFYERQAPRTTVELLSERPAKAIRFTSDQTIEYARRLPLEVDPHHHIR